MTGFYKHQSGKHIWVMEVLRQKNDKEMYALQYTPNSKCPVSYDCYISSLDEDRWVKITDEEAEKLIVNLTEQRETYEYRQTDENKKWAEQLAQALKFLSGVSCSSGVVRIENRSGEFSISRDKDGNVTSEKTGEPDPW